MKETPEQIFQLWYEKPLQVLEGIEDGSGATVALATALFLYERYFSALSRAKPAQTTAQTIADQLAHDLPADKPAAEIFWEMSRNGLLHQGMILQAARSKAYPAYSMAPTYRLPLELITTGRSLLKINPWTIVHRVVELWKAKIELFDSNPSIPVAKRYKVKEHYFTDYPGHIEYELQEEA